MLQEIMWGLLRKNVLESYYILQEYALNKYIEADLLFD